MIQLYSSRVALRVRILPHVLCYKTPVCLWVLSALYSVSDVREAAGRVWGD